MMKYVFLLLFSLLTGCFPHCYRAQQLPLECTDIAENVGAAFESDAVCEGVYPDEQWWTFFQDPQLNTLIEMSLNTHPDIKMAEARIRRACEEAVETRSALIPHLFWFGEGSREKLSRFGSRTQIPTSIEYITEVTTYLTTASYELDIWKKNRNLYFASIDEMVAQIADYQEARLVLSTTIASVYFDLQYNLELLRIANERLDTRKQVYALLLQRFENGVNSEFRLYETDTEIQLIQDLVFQLEGFVGVDRHALAALIGNTTCCFEGELVIEPAAVFNTPLPLPSTLPTDLLLRRPDVTAQKCRVEAACCNVEVAKAHFFPRIDLLGYLGFGSFKLSKLFTKPTLLYLGDAVGLLPLFTAGKLQAQLGVSRENLEIAVESYNQTVLNAVQQVSDSLTDLMTADARLGALQKSVADAKSLYDLTYQKFVNGVSDRISVLNGLENVFTQEELEAVVQLCRFQSAVSLIQSIGGGYYDGCCP
ncbi:MAG: Outer membrane protein OprM [Chlamydiales bacterium]|nr:Outer membrane protein OprM [Chlamydiales bacterium]